MTNDKHQGASQEPRKPSRLGAIVKLFRWVLVLLVVGGLVWSVVAITVRETITEEELKAWIEGFGTTAPLAFVVLFALAGSLLIPTTLLTMTGALLFGPLVGFSYSMLGAFLAGLLGFSIARLLGAKAVARWLEKSKGRMANLDRRLEEHGFTTALYMRLLYIPNTLINLVCGVSSMRLSAYAAGTLLGLVPWAYAVTFVTSSIKDAVLSRDWSVLGEAESVFAVVLFIVCFTIPFIHKAIVSRSAGGGTAGDGPTCT